MLVCAKFLSKMGRDLNLKHLGGRDLNFRAVSIQKVVVGKMASTDPRCTGGGGGLDPFSMRWQQYILN